MFCLYLFFSGQSWSYEYSGTTGLIFTNILGLVELCKYFINSAFIWQSLNLRQKSAFLQTNLHCCVAIPKWIEISERQWTGQKCIKCGYVVYKFGKVWSSNSGYLFASFCTHVNKFAKIGISGEYLRIHMTDLNQFFSIGGHKCEDD